MNQTTALCHVCGRHVGFHWWLRCMHVWQGMIQAEAAMDVRDHETGLLLGLGSYSMDADRAQPTFVSRSRAPHPQPTNASDRESDAFSSFHTSPPSTSQEYICLPPIAIGAGGYVRAYCTYVVNKAKRTFPSFHGRPC